MRIAPDDATLAQRLESQMVRKADKLKPYRAAGMRTVLLLDSGDIALMNIERLVDAVRSKFPSGLLEGVDELWYADSSVPGALEFWDITHEVSKPNRAV
jgi:hypothetical protein